MSNLSGRHVIAGIGHTAFGKLPGSDTVSLNVEACRNAIADAGIDKSVVDAVFVKVPTSAHQFMFGQKVAEALGIAPRIGGAWDQGGAANITLLSFAIMAIEAKQFLKTEAVAIEADDRREIVRRSRHAQDEMRFHFWSPFWVGFETGWIAGATALAHCVTTSPAMMNASPAKRAIFTGRWAKLIKAK